MSAPTPSSSTSARVGVWAPDATSVDLHTTTVEPMRPRGEGWWESTSALKSSGSRPADR